MNIATYCPEDNKLRLYVGRVPREEYLKLKAEGWTSTPKQDCDFVATWTPGRRDTALDYAEIILDEDQTPEDRAADRAERFSDYRDKRTAEATASADTYDAGGSACGFQSQQRAERAAARLDRVASRACDSWSKAEYWQRRTAGVRNHALHVSSPAVRMGRIKTIEAEKRKLEASIASHAKDFRAWKKVEAMEPEKQTKAALALANYCHGYGYKHPRPENVSDYIRENGTSLYSLLTLESDPITGAEAAAPWLHGVIDPEGEAYQNTSPAEWLKHFELRLAYENQMLEAQGGRAAFVEMEAGGFIGKHQIQKVNKSPATGRTVSVAVLAPTGANYDRHGKPYNEANPRPLTLHTLNIERLPADSYRAPTDEEKAAFLASRKAAKAAAPIKAACPLVNPTEEEAGRLQAILNKRAHDQHAQAVKLGRHYGDFQPATLTRISQAVYSANSKGTYARTETRGLCKDAQLKDRFSELYSRQRDEAEKAKGEPVCMVRITSGGSGYYTPESIIVLTDKPQNKFPAEVWSVSAAPEPTPEQPEPVTKAAAIIAEMMKQSELFA